MWPLTLFLFVIGVAVGCSAFLSANKQVFSAEAEVLVLNETENLVGANDYLYLAKGDSVTKQTNNDNCSAQITQAGNILDLVATCSSSSEDAENYLKNFILAFSDTLDKTYGHDIVKTITVKLPQPTAETTSFSEKMLALFAPIIAVLVVSFVIAFIIA